jgi:hypothetical protein
MADKDIQKSVLENELLTDEVRSQIAEAIEAAKEEAASKVRAELEAEKEVAIAEAREQVEAEVRTDLAAKYVAEREELAADLGSKLEELLAVEVEELKEDIASFRDLEVEKALEIEEEKERLAEQYAAEREALIEKLGEFVEARLKVELEELAEDIRMVKENTFAREIFDVFAQVYADSFVNEGALGPSVQDRLKDANEAKEEALERAAALQEQVDQMGRDRELERVLAPLSGKRRAVMETLLDRVSTTDFAKVYDRMLPKVMDTVDAQAAETVSEGTETDEVEEEETLTEAPEGTVLAEGDEEEVVTEEDLSSEPTIEDDARQWLRKAAGLR